MTDALSPKWPAATAALVALAEHGISADIGELLAHGNPARGVAPGAIFKMIEAISLVAAGEGLSVVDAWQDLVDKDDRTSPEQNPDMALITYEELADYMQSALPRGRAAAPVASDGQPLGAKGGDATPADWRDDMLGYAYQFIGSLMELSSDPALSVVLDAFAEPGPGKVVGLPVPGTIKFDQPTSQQLQEIWDWYDEISFARVKAGLPDNMLKFCGVKNGAEEWIVYQDQGGPSLVHGRSAFDALTKLRALRDRLA